MGRKKSRSKSNHIRGKKGSQFRTELRGLDLSKVLVVAIDAAKYYQKAMVCNFYGDMLLEPTFFGVNKVEIEAFHKKVEEVKVKEEAEKVFVGIEATSHYYEDVVRELEKLGYDVTIINAATTYEERSSALNWSKTDDLDLVAIAQVIIQNKGMQNKLPTGKQHDLMVLTRARRKEVGKRSRLKVEVRELMDKIWREYQGHVKVTNGKPEKVELFSDFWGKSSLFIMEHYPHPEDILAMTEEELREVSIEHNLKIREGVLTNLFYVASVSLARPKEQVKAELLLLKMALTSMQFLNENIKRLEEEIERILIETDGRLLLSVPGIGVISAAEFYSEIGDLTHYDHAGQLIKKAGTNPMVIQSGGQSGFYGRISKQGNRHLRFIVYTIGKLLAQHNKDLRPYFDALISRGKHHRQAYIAMGNKFIRIAFSMLKNKTVYQTQDTSYQYLKMMREKLRNTELQTFYRIVTAG